MKLIVISQLIHDFIMISLHIGSYIYQHLIQDLYYFSIPTVTGS